MTAGSVTLLVVAKAPVPGRAKTRLAAVLGPEAAADVAAAALLDTLDAVLAAAHALGSGPPVVAWDGDVDAGARAHEVRTALALCRVVAQPDVPFAERLVAAHQAAAEADDGADWRRDVPREADPGVPRTAPDRLAPDRLAQDRVAQDRVVQIGMDTPQVTAADLVEAAAALNRADAALGPAEDGGWWALAVRDPAHAQGLRDVPMSRPDTAERTWSALTGRGLRVERLRVLRDVDTWEDARAVAGRAGLRFRQTVARYA